MKLKLYPTTFAGSVLFSICSIAFCAACAAIFAYKAEYLSAAFMLAMGTVQWAFILFMQVLHARQDRAMVELETAKEMLRQVKDNPLAGIEYPLAPDPMRRH